MRSAANVDAHDAGQPVEQRGDPAQQLALVGVEGVEVAG